MTMDTPARTGSFELIDVEVHQKSIRNIASEMAITLMRTSGSPVVTEAKDFSTCILDAKLDQLAFSGYVTFHIATAVPGVEAVLRNVAVEDIAPGDAFICNDPHTSGAIHQGDIGIVMPFFREGEIFSWGYVNEHVLDIGGSAVSGFAPGAFDSFAETLAFPGTRIIREGRIDRQWEQFFATNVRMAGTVLNDMRSMIAANNAGRQRLVAMVEEIGIGRFDELNEESKRLSEEAMRRTIAALPDGTYESEDWVEFDGRGRQELHEMRCRVVIGSDEMTIQFRGGPQTDSFINGAAPAMIGQTWSTLLAQIAYDIPVNAGIWRPIHFDLGPAGTIVNSTPPAPVSQSHMETGMRVNKVMSDVLSQACGLCDDDRLRARVEGQVPQNMSFFTAFGIDRRNGLPTVAFPMSIGMSSGGAAQTTSDGMEVYAATCMSGCDMPDVEMEETTQPGMILWRRVARDTGGAGLYRGGLGVDSALTIEHCDRMTGGAYTNTAQVPPRGGAGGFPGAAGRWRIIRDSNVLDLLERGVFPDRDALEGHEDEMPSKVGQLVLDRGDIFTVVNGGGGGVGDPLLRPPTRVAADVADGYVSTEVARDIYGVVLAVDGAAHEGATEKARAEIRAARIGGVPANAVEDPIRGLAPLRVEEGEWRCNICGQDLGPASANWRERAVTREVEISERYRELRSQVRPRTEDEAVVMRENFCPGCASSLAVDITLEGRDPVPPSRPGVKEPLVDAALAT
jgi:N-methylhydantoinase B